MNETWGLRSHYRNVGLACLVFYTGMVVFSVLEALWAVPAESRVYTLLFLPAFWLVMVGLSVWTLLAYKRYALTIRDHHLVEKGVFSSREIPFSEVVELQWRVTPQGGRIVLKTANRQVRLRLDGFEQAQRLALIRFLRNKLPLAIQQDWPLFCYKIALPLREAPFEREPRDDETRITRRHWNRYFLPTVIVAAAMSVFFWWTLGLSRLLAAPMGVAALWWAIRVMTPRQGVIAKRLAHSEDRRIVAALLLGLILLFPLILLARLLETWHPAAGITLMLLGALPLFFLVIRETAQSERRRQEQARQAVPEAVTEWERQEMLA